MQIDWTKQIIKSVCLKCPVSSLIDTLRKWNRLSETTLNSLTTTGSKPKNKTKFTQNILSCTNEEDIELTVDIAGDLELAYIQLHPKKRLWKVFKISGGCFSNNHDPRVLRGRLIKEIQSKWKKGFIYGNIGQYKGALWLRVHFDTSKTKSKVNPSQRSLNARSGIDSSYNPNRSVYIVYFPSSPYVIVSNTRVTELDLLTKSLQLVFNADKLTYLQLSDRNIFSLADIVLGKTQKRSKVERFRQLEDKENPVSLNQRKRKQSEADSSDEPLIVDEDREWKKMRHLHVEKRLGDVEEQPVLEKIEYKFTLDFHGQPITVYNRECTSRVRLKGSDVLTGVCQLATKGFMKLPMPQHVSGVVQQKRNAFTVASANRADSVVERSQAL